MACEAAPAIDSGRSGADRAAVADDLPAVAHLHCRHSECANVMVSQISYLNTILGGADKQPGQEEVNRYQELLKQFNALKQEVKL